MSTKVEKFDLIYDSTTDNDYNVPDKQWRKWSPKQRQMFNMIWSAMTDDPKVFQHPASDIPYEQWKTIAWNAAWTAADFVDKHEVGE